jgi:hypothetical protein
MRRCNVCDLLGTPTRPTNMHHRDSRHISLGRVPTIEHSHLGVCLVCIDSEFNDAIWDSAAHEDVTTTERSTWCGPFSSNKRIDILCIVGLGYCQAGEGQCLQKTARGRHDGSGEETWLAAELSTEGLPWTGHAMRSGNTPISRRQLPASLSCVISGIDG